jgi:uncharacterized C2H2 Zn-finger protein
LTFKVHDANSDFKCPICSVHFNTQHNLTRHISWVHEKKESKWPGKMKKLKVEKVKSKKVKIKKVKIKKEICEDDNLEYENLEYENGDEVNESLEYEYPEMSNQTNIKQELFESNYELDETGYYDYENEDQSFENDYYGSNEQNISNLCEPKMEEMQGKVEFSNDVIIPQSYQKNARYSNETTIKEELLDEPYFEDQTVIEPKTEPLDFIPGD